MPPNLQHHDAWDQDGAGAADTVKTASRPFVHHVSHGQVELDGAYFLSLCAEEGEDGETVSDLVQEVLRRLPDPSVFYAGLTRVGCSLQTLELSKARRVMLTAPALFRAEDVPRVREIDSGVSSVRYTVTLEAGRALRGTQLTDAAALFGLDLRK